MNRVYQLLTKLYEIIDAQPSSTARDETLDWERLHSASSARLAFLLALERGVDPEHAACAAAVHDYGRIITGKQDDHAEAGYDPVQNFLLSTGLFGDREIAVIALAVKNHSNKKSVGTPIEEIVKDADVIDCYQYGLPFDRPEKKTRYDAWLKDHQSPGLPECY